MTAALDGVRDQQHAPAVHYPRESPGGNVRPEIGLAPGLVWTGGKSRPHRDSTPDRPARSQSLYRLSYPAHFNTVKGKKGKVIPLEARCGPEGG